MSISKEKWDVEQESASTYSIHTKLGGLEASGEHAEELLKRVAVLPKALALLDSWQKEHDKTCDCTRCAKTLDILRRAGVLT